MKRAILLHGWDGSPDQGWLPWLKAELESKGWQVSTPFMPEAATPTQDKWVSALAEQVGQPDVDTYLVGHSLGGITILRYLESLQPDQQIGGAVFVAGFAQDLRYEGYKQELASFFSDDLDWAAVREHCKQFFALQSTDDSWVDESNYHELRDKLDADGELQTGFKHYSGDDSVTELPIVLESLLEMAA